MAEEVKVDADYAFNELVPSDTGLLSTGEVADDLSSTYQDTQDNLASVDVPEYSTPEVSADITAGSEYVTPEASVANQLTELLSSDSPYMQQVANASAEQANQLGLLSSSMAVGAGQRAAITEALPIAQQDASTYATFQGAEQAADYGIQSDIASAELSAALSAYKTGVEASYSAVLKDMDAQTTALLTEAQMQWEESMQTNLVNLEGEWNTSLLDGQMSQSQYDSAMDSVSNILLNTQSNITSLLADPDIASMDAESVAAMLNNIQASATASIEFVSGLGNIPQEELDILLESYELATEWSVAEEVM